MDSPPADPQQMKLCQNVYLVPNTPDVKPDITSENNLDKVSLLTYQEDDKRPSTRTSTPAEFDYSPKRKTKPRICTKHETHTPEELERCLDLMEKNRIASLKSRRKKLTTIDQQKGTIQGLENQIKQLQLINRKSEAEKLKIKNENQELKAIVTSLQSQLTNLQAQMEQLILNQHEEKSASPEIDVEKIDDSTESPSSVENVSNLMQNATLAQSPMCLNPELINLMCSISPEFCREINRINCLKSPYTPPNFNTPPPTPTMDQLQRMQPSPLILKPDRTNIQYAPKPGSLNLDDHSPFVHNSSKYHSPLFQKIVYQFYGESPLRLGATLPSTSKDVQK